jgi:hypothetical protein
LHHPGPAFVVRTNDTRDVLRFRAAVDQTEQLIDIRLNTYIELLRAERRFSPPATI